MDGERRAVGCGAGAFVGADTLIAALLMVSLDGAALAVALGVQLLVTLTVVVAAAYYRDEWP